MLGTLPAFLALLSLCVFFASLRGVRPGAAPLLALCAVVLFFTPAGILGVLAPAGWVFYLLCFALGAWALWRRGGLGLLRRFWCPGTALFAVGGLLLMVLLAVRQPPFSQWDEFVLWGTAGKWMKLTNTLYTTAGDAIGWFWTATQSPGMMILGWFGQFFAPDFAPWRVFWAYDLLYLACAAALAAPFGWNRWRTAVPLGVLGLLLPFAFGTHYSTVVLSTVYTSAYADLPAGILFGGALAVYFGARLGGDVAGRAPAGARGALWPALLPLAALALVKDNVFPVALVAAGIMAADCLLFGVGGRLRPWGRPAVKELLGRVGAAAAAFAAPVGAYLMWSAHAARAAAQNAAAGSGATNASPFQLVLPALRQLFVPAEREENFQSAMASMGDNFMGRLPGGGSYNVSALGTALFTGVVIVLLFALAWWLYGPGRARVAVAGALALGGFVGYHFVLLVFYGLMYHGRGAGDIPEYARYLGAYLPGWFMLGLLFLALAAANGGGRRARLARGGVLALCCALALRCAVLVRPGYSLLDYPDRLYAGQRETQAKADAVAAAVPPGGRVFFVCQGGNGQEWFEYSYHLLPVVLDYSVTGGRSLWLPEGDAAAGYTLEGLQTFAELQAYIANNGQTLEGVRRYLAQGGCDYILIDRLDDAFVEIYGALFQGGLEDWPGHTTLYRRQPGGLYAPAQQAEGETP